MEEIRAAVLLLVHIIQKMIICAVPVSLTIRARIDYSFDPSQFIGTFVAGGHDVLGTFHFFFLSSDGAMHGIVIAAAMLCFYVLLFLRTFSREVCPFGAAVYRNSFFRWDSSLS